MIQMKYDDVIVKMQDTIMDHGEVIDIKKAVSLAKELQSITDADFAVVDCCDNTITVQHNHDDKLRYGSNRISICNNGDDDFETTRTVIAAIKRYKEFIRRIW